MTKDQIRIGGTYLARVTDRVVPVRLDATNRHGGWDATNLATGKKVRIKSAQRLRGPAGVPTAPQNDEQRTPEQDDRAARAAHAANAHAVDPDRIPLAEAMKPAKAKRGNVAKEPKEKTPSGLDAAAQVLKDAGQPMRCGDMVEKMLADGLWRTDGKTPAATIYAAIIREISVKGGESRFKKTDRGLFTVNAN